MTSRRSLSPIGLDHLLGRGVWLLPWSHFHYGATPSASVMTSPHDRYLEARDVESLNGTCVFQSRRTWFLAGPHRSPVRGGLGLSGIHFDSSGIVLRRQGNLRLSYQGGELGIQTVDRT